VRIAASGAGTAQVMVPRQPVAKAVRQAQDPLPYGHVWEDVVHQMCGALGHSAASAAWARAASLTRKGDQPIQAAGRTTKSCEPASQRAAAQTLTKRVLNARGQALAVPKDRGLRSKAFEVRLHDLVETVLGGIAGFVARGR
jgi:hypothetical protein